MRTLCAKLLASYMACMTHINAAAGSARKDARATDGRFGTQTHSTRRPYSSRTEPQGSSDSKSCDSNSRPWKPSTTSGCGNRPIRSLPPQLAWPRFEFFRVNEGEPVEAVWRRW